MIHSEHAQAEVIKVANELIRKLDPNGDGGILVTITIQDTNTADLSKGTHVCTNVSVDKQIQGEYLIALGHVVKASIK